MKTQSAFFCLVFAVCINPGTIIKAQVNVQDSLALVDLYNSTNGPSWYRHNNWLTGPVSSWYGIQVTGDRVSMIDLAENNLDGFIPSSLGDLADLSDLYLNANQLQGNIPPELGKLSNLSGASLNNNQFGGSIPPALGKLPNLYYLYLDNNQLSGNIPPELGNLGSLYALNLSSNRLSGVLPPELARLSNLSYFAAADNQLSGSIPGEFGNLSALFSLDLQNNKLTGQIPHELGNLSDLASLYLHNNRLSGHIPPELGNLSNLYYLYLNNNQLSGHIPPGLGNLSLLYHLYLDHNRLSGHIPGSIASLNLALLDLSHNRLTFDGMELIAATFPFARYGKQAPVRVKSNDNILFVSAGGTLSNNTYYWHKAGSPGKVTKIEGDSVFHPTETGVYYVRVSNKIATKLNLTSYPVRYSVPVPLNLTAGNKPVIFNNDFSVYPNPAKDILHVKANTDASFSLLNQSGEVLLTANINKEGSIKISGMAMGVYFLKHNITNASKKIFIVR